jgi:hypothetical protein
MSSRKSAGNESQARARKNSRLENIEALIDGEGNITIGRIGPIRCAAVAADDDQALAMLVGRKDESFYNLLERLDAAIGMAWEQDIFTDEING